MIGKVLAYKPAEFFGRRRVSGSRNDVSDDNNIVIVQLPCRYSRFSDRRMLPQDSLDLLQIHGVPTNLHPKTFSTVMLKAAVRAYHPKITCEIQRLAGVFFIMAE